MALATGLTPPTPQVGRPPRLVSIIVLVLFILGTIVPTLISFYTDLLWFGEVDFRGVFNKVILTRIALFVGFGLISALVVWIAATITLRGRPSEESRMFELDRQMYEYRKQLDRTTRKVLQFLPLIVGVVAGFLGQRSWRVVQLFLNRQDFGMTDQQFGVDYGFYAFTLPMIRLVVGTLSTLLVLAFIIALIGHYLLGNITAGNAAAGQKSRIARYAQIQLAVTAGIWMLLKAVGYWLDRYDLLLNRHETFVGASYTDIHAVLPAKLILLFIAILVAVSFFSVIFLKDLRIPALTTVLMVLSSLVIGNAWPIMMERFSVQPNRAEKESEYISRNIEATRFAYGLTDENVTYQENWGAKGASKDAVASDVATVSNIRLLDPEIISPTFTQLQQLKNFYGFPASLAMDRYEIDGELRDFVVAAREINPNSLRENQQNWINRHTVYTHGNGFVAAQANQVDEVARDVGSARGGYPVFTVSDLQTTDEDAKKLGIVVKEPRVYFGPLISSAEDGKDYAVVGSDNGNSVEYDTDSSTYTYAGKGGVDIGNFFNRAAFAARYQELNLILSERVNSKSKILFERDPRTRVHKVAPWLTTDSTTYPAVIDGRIKWIVDGYTTLGSLPYASRTSLTAATNDTSGDVGSAQRPLVTDEVGYIRNSVKAVVDAYDGSVELYQFDKQDPVLKAWMGVFPDTVKPKEEISTELMDHIRYPQDMFKVQRAILARYHVDEARDFFTNDRFWSVPDDPSADESNRAAQPPFYVVAADPESGKPSFQLITPFRGLNRQYLAAHMSVSSDPQTYGKITVRVLPTDTLTQGPQQAQDTMISSDQVARDQTLWKATTDLKNGNLLTLPVGGGEILYVEPIYSKRKGQESAFPKLLRVLVSYKGQVGYAPTVSEALAQVGIDPRAAQDLAEAEGITTAPTESDSAPTDGEQQQDVPTPPAAAANEAEAIKGINEALDKLRDARSGTHEEYGKALDALDKAVEDYQKIAK
ncbi:MAG: UPF0182 family protein [Corynebacterium sp.]|uniref:UPF0182 family protein n=1 Tax=Corynebacterium sp. TaxID=1720 RepID=UPI0026DB3E89|nr:UPF0182 family protein [Corynebacterium sp.]MDO5097558.1 UPF0182 family protein [Corynebacterium sp.]